jgi:hypothetical protein
VEKHGERLPYDLAAKRNGVIENELLSFGRQIAPQFARSPSQSNKELSLRLLSTWLLGIHRFSAPFCRGDLKAALRRPGRRRRVSRWSVPTTLGYFAGGSWVCVDPGALSGLPPGICAVPPELGAAELGAAPVVAGGTGRTIVAGGAAGRTVEGLPSVGVTDCACARTAAARTAAPVTTASDVFRIL